VHRSYGKGARARAHQRLMRTKPGVGCALCARGRAVCVGCVSAAAEGVSTRRWAPLTARRATTADDAALPPRGAPARLRRDAAAARPSAARGAHAREVACSMALVMEALADGGARALVFGPSKQLDASSAGRDACSLAVIPLPPPPSVLRVGAEPAALRCGRARVLCQQVVRTQASCCKASFRGFAARVARASGIQSAWLSLLLRSWCKPVIGGAGARFRDCVSQAQARSCLCADRRSERRNPTCTPTHNAAVTHYGRCRGCCRAAQWLGAWRQCACSSCCSALGRRRC
jgi:hypothetical protein